jgi:choline dehydrogenase-like flavoprotein
VTIVEASSLTSGVTMRPDVVVIGSGPAGMTVARGLLASGLDIVVVESGGGEPSGPSHELADGDVVGGTFLFEHEALGLADVRIRALGGTSGHWNGMCRPLDPLDLRARPEIGRVGWPITSDELQPWYAMAQATCELGPASFDAAPWYAAQEQPVPLHGPTATTALYRLSAPTRFGTRYRPELEAAEHCTVVLHATVVALVPTADGGHVTRVQAISDRGTTLDIDAEIVVLATGGVDVPRLLLLSTGASPAGLANATGLVGAGFMEHPHVRLGRFAVTLDQAIVNLNPHRGEGAFAGMTAWPSFRLTPEVLEDRGLLAAALTIDGLDHQTQAAGEELGPGVEELLAAGGSPVTMRPATLRAEQLPLAEHMVRLGRRRDALGQPVAEVRWTVDDGALASARTTAQLLADELGRAGIGRLELAPGGGHLRRDAVEIGCHHMGTARMSSDPALGVVQPDGRCHEVDNLYIAGSAVFPTSGYANPTLTIVALAHRLAATIAGSA